MKRVRTGRVIVALALGALLHTLVAWGLFTCRGAFKMPTVGAVTLDSVDGWVPREFAAGIGEPDEIQREHSLHSNTWFYVYRSELEPSDAEGYRQQRHAFSYEVRVGFPFESFASVTATTLKIYHPEPGGSTAQIPAKTSETTPRTMFDKPFTIGNGYFSIGKIVFLPQQIPYRPLLLGFTANTLLYGAGVYAGLAGFAAWRERRRILPGMCAGCRYEVGGLAVCPECGREQG